MIKLVLQNLDGEGNLTDTTHCGCLRSYKSIGKHLYHGGKPGKYYAIPNNIVSIAAISEITVTRDKFGKQVEMKGSIY